MTKRRRPIDTSVDGMWFVHYRCEIYNLNPNGFTVGMVASNSYRNKNMIQISCFLPSACTHSTHLLLKPEYSGQTRSIPWLPRRKTDILSAHNQHQAWCWLCALRISVFFGSEFQISVTFQGQGMIQNSNVVLCFLRNIHRKGQLPQTPQ